MFFICFLLQLLTEMVFEGSQFLERVPDVSGALNLRKINIKGCQILVEVHDSLGFLDQLVLLDASGCTNLHILPRSIKSASLQYLDLSNCFRLWNVSEIFGLNENNLTTSHVDRYSISILSGCLFLYKSPEKLQLRCSNLMLSKLENLNDEFRHFNKCSGDDQEKVSPALPINLEIYCWDE